MVNGSPMSDPLWMAYAFKYGKLLLKLMRQIYDVLMISI